MTIRFTKTGTFTFYCAVHPGMKGKVHVVAAHAKAPSAKADARTVSKEVTAGLKAAKRLAAAKPTPGVVSIGRSAAHGVESYDFLPGAQTVPVGTTLTFKMPVGSTEDHTATTGPGNPMTEPDSYLGKLAASFQSPQIAPEAIYPSEAPGTAGALSATSHGNGFWNTGVLDSSPQTPLPASSTVTFTQAGTYQFFCLIHPFMHATITVQ
jgi:plastocyanin